MSKIILTDVDGVLLDWNQSFEQYLLTHGHTKVPGGDAEYSIGKRYGLTKETAYALVAQFNESAAIGFLNPYKDAVHYVKRLNEEHGYRFCAITCLGTDPSAKRLRTENLRRLFGDVFNDIVCLPLKDDKRQALQCYTDECHWWIEDKPENCVTGAELGHASILMQHTHNEGFNHPRITTVNSWKEIYKLVTLVTGE